ncbi:hypothetical protein B0T24DRAFT_643057, partial [Lasiosphaeria ovina]
MPVQLYRIIGPLAWLLLLGEKHHRHAQRPAIRGPNACLSAHPSDWPPHSVSRQAPFPSMRVLASFCGLHPVFVTVDPSSVAPRAMPCHAMPPRHARPRRALH